MKQLFENWKVNEAKNTIQSTVLWVGRSSICIHTKSNENSNLQNIEISFDEESTLFVCSLISLTWFLSFSFYKKTDWVCDSQTCDDFVGIISNIVLTFLCEFERNAKISIRWRTTTFVSSFLSVIYSDLRLSKWLMQKRQRESES